MILVACRVVIDNLSCEDATVIQVFLVFISFLSFWISRLDSCSSRPGAPTDTFNYDFLKFEK